MRILPVSVPVPVPVPVPGANSMPAPVAVPCASYWWQYQCAKFMPNIDRSQIRHRGRTKRSTTLFNQKTVANSAAQGEANKGGMGGKDSRWEGGGEMGREKVSR